MTDAAIKLPHPAPYTVDELFDLPDDGHRYDVFGGSLVMSPAPAPMHQLVAVGPDAWITVTLDPAGLVTL